MQDKNACLHRTCASKMFTLS